MTASYDRAFRDRTHILRIREDDDADAAFLRDLYVACSPLRDILPPPLLIQQAEAQRASHRRDYPDAMWRIVTHGDVPLGRIAIDWSQPDVSQGVDIAVLPSARSTGAGLAMMRAWIHVADALQRPARLSVVRDNPAARLYRHLGFLPVEPDDGTTPMLEMIRQPRSVTKG